MNSRRPVRFPTLIHGSSPDVSGLSDWDYDEAWQELDTFYRENERVINECLVRNVEKAASDDKIGEVYLTMDSFMSTVDVVLDGLVALGNVHPILGSE